MRLRYFIFYGLIIYSIFVSYFYITVGLDERYETSKQEAAINSKIISELEKCGAGYWVTWASVKTDQSEYVIKDVFGSVKEGECAIGIKKMALNQFYEKSHKIDENSFQFFKEIETGFAGYYDDMLFFGDKEAIKLAIESANKKINSIAFSTVKDNNDIILYYFTLTNTSEGGVCGKSEMVQTLENITLFSKKVLVDN